MVFADGSQLPDKIISQIRIIGETSLSKVRLIQLFVGGGILYLLVKKGGIFYNEVVFTIRKRQVVFTTGENILSCWRHASFLTSPGYSLFT
jgi:hypothetical protein